MTRTEIKIQLEVLVLNDLKQAGVIDEATYELVKDSLIKTPSSPAPDVPIAS